MSRIAAETGIDFGSRAFTLDELNAVSLELPEEIIENMLFQGETVALVGRPKMGKSRIAQQLAVAVATGTDFFGMKTKQMPVLYVDFENPPAFARARFNRILGEPKFGMSNLHLYTVPTLAHSQVGLYGEHKEKLRSMIRETRAGLLVIDTWRLIFEGRENQSEDMIRALRDLDELRKDNPDLAILLVHHLRKFDNEAMHKKSQRVALRDNPEVWLDNVAGSGAFVAHTDATFGLEREKSASGFLYILTGVRRNGDAPLLVLESDPTSLRFELASGTQQVEDTIFTDAQLALWRKLPDEFTWTTAEKEASSKSVLSGTIKQAIANGLLHKEERGTYRKVRTFS